MSLRPTVIYVVVESEGLDQVGLGIKLNMEYILI